jgi:glycosyl transferase family 2
MPTDTAANFEFVPTTAVATARSHTQFVQCPACRADTPNYLFHREGVRFVRCAACGVVYVNPARESPINYLDIEKGPIPTSARDRALMSADFAKLLDRVAADHQRLVGAPLQRTLLVGRYLREYAHMPEAKRIGLEIAEIDDAAFTRLAVSSDLAWLQPLIASKPQFVILHELLEACRDPGKIIDGLVKALPDAYFAISYTNADSLPARVARRYWASFFDYKAVFLTTNNLTALCARHGLVLKDQFPQPETRTVGYVAEKLLSLRAPILRELPLPLRSGARVAVFGRAARDAARAEKLSIVLPVFNEARYAAQVIEAVLAKPLKIDRELIIVESNSTDGTREIVQKFEGRPGVRLILEERPRGKGHAVRTGLAHVTGTIVLIQDADFEYDIDDYDALLEPLLQHKTTFVLGSRSLGLDDWKVRRYAATPWRHVVLNFAQVMFAKTYNVLYQQRVTDVNTMFKVFRAECLDGLDLQSNGFDLDIELACKLARNGNSPMEVPVNYNARGFEDGKKISFVRDSFPTYAAFFRHRFS